MVIKIIFLYMEMENLLLGFKIIYVLMVFIDGIIIRRFLSIFFLFFLCNKFRVGECL